MTWQFQTFLLIAGPAILAAFVKGVLEVRANRRMWAKPTRRTFNPPIQF